MWNHARNLAAQAVRHGGRGVGASIGGARAKLAAARGVHRSRAGTSSGTQGQLFDANGFLPPSTPAPQPGRLARAGGFARRHPAMTAGAGMGAAGFATGRMTGGRGGGGRSSSRPTPGPTIRGGTPGAGGAGPVGGGQPGMGRPTV